MNTPSLVTAATASLGLFAAMTAMAGASAEGPGTPQAVAAHAEFLSSLPAPPTGAGSVCVIDSGVDTDTDLGPALNTRSAFDGGTPNDVGARGDDGTQLPKHGTYVAGVIASQVDGVGTSGIWPAAKVMSRRVFGGPMMGTTANDYIRAIDWCTNQRVSVNVINLSLSGLTATLTERQSLEDKIGQVRRAPYNVNVVAAAGNNGLSYVGYPGSGAGVFAVGATDESGKIASFSNYGTGLDISTFGTATCVTTGYRDHVAVGHGTSYAAPVVSAVLNALRSYQPWLTPDQAEQLLMTNADTTIAGRTLNAATTFAAAGIISSRDAAAGYARIPCTPEPIVSDAGAASGPGSTSSAATATDGVAVPATSGAAVPTSAHAVGLTPQPLPLLDVQVPANDGIPTRKPMLPIIRSVTVRKGVLTVKIAGRGSADKAIFHVTQKIKFHSGWRRLTTIYERLSNTLRIEAGRWTLIRVLLRRPGVGNSKAATAHAQTDLR
jgi:hypothetical protein